MAATLVDFIFKCNFVNENVLISIRIWLNFVPNGPIDNKSSLVQIMAWCFHYLNQWWPGSLTHTCITQPQWVKLVYTTLNHAVNEDGYQWKYSYILLNDFNNDSNGWWYWVKSIHYHYSCLCWIKTVSPINIMSVNAMEVQVTGASAALVLTVWGNYKHLSFNATVTIFKNSDANLYRCFYQDPNFSSSIITNNK